MKAISDLTTLRILYSTGPGDVAGTFEHWELGKDDPSQLSITYSSQFYDIWRRLGFHAYVISPAKRVRNVSRPRMTIVQRPIPWRKAHGLRYHLGRLLFACRLIHAALRFRADIAIVTSGTHWFLLSILPFLGIKTIPSLHTNVCDPNLAVTRLQNVILVLNRRFFLKRCPALLCASQAIASHIVSPAHSSSPSVSVFLPTYSPHAFAELPRARWDSRPWSILYAGRLEREKGALDLLSIMDRLVHNHCDAVLSICGTGTCESLMRSHVDKRGLMRRVQFHGHVGPVALRKCFAQCHVVIAPTRTECGEGFNQVPMEAILAGRPVVVSRACPSLEIVRDAAIEVRPNAIEDYCEAILTLSRDQKLYEQKVDCCVRYREALLGGANSWHAHVERVLTKLSCDRYGSAGH